MILQFMDSDSISAVKSNLKDLSRNFSGSNEWLIEFFDGKSPFKDTKFEIEDFQLDMSQQDPFLTEYENVRRVYTRLKFLSDSQASDERLWAGLCMGPFYDYVKYRWKITGRSTPEQICQHYFFGFTARRSLTRNALSRLWWIGRLTYDEKREYEFTQFVCENADNIMHILERNTSNNPVIVKAFISAILDAKKEGKAINTDGIGELSKYLNLLGGTYILDCLPAEWTYDKIKKKALEL